MTAPAINAEFCIRLSYCLLHSLWAGSVVALLAAFFISNKKLTPNIRYCALIAAELVVFLLLPTAYLYLDARNTFAGSYAIPNKPQILSSVNANEPHAIEEPVNINVQALAPTKDSYPVYVATIYLAGVGMMLTRLIIGLYGGRKLVGASRPITEVKVLKTISRAVEAMRFTYTPAIAYCGSVVVPCVVSVLRPTLLLPFVVATELTPQQLEVLVMHELAHIRRHDHVVNLIQRIVEAFLFFHPAIWFLSRRIRVERELCCDDLVVAAGRDPQLYARSLLRIMELGASDPLTDVTLVQLAATGERSQLRHRILRLMTPPRPVHTVRLKNVSAVIASLLAAAILLTPVSFGMLKFQRAGTLPKLLEADFATIDRRMQSGWTRLHATAVYGTPEQLDTLLANHENPNIPNDMGESPLHLATTAHRRDNAGRLLDNNAKIDQQDNQGRTPLLDALGMGPWLPEITPVIDDQMGLYLLDRNANPTIADRNGIAPLHEAVIGRLHATREALLKRKAPVDARDNHLRTALHYSALIADPDSIASLLENHGDPNALDANGWSPLDMLGLQIRTLGKVSQADIFMSRDLLLKAGAKPDLSAAVALSMHEFVDHELAKNPALVDALPSKTVNGNRLLHWAAAASDAEMCDMLTLKYHGDVSAKNALGQMPLHVDLQRHPAVPEVTESLLNANAPVDAPDKFGATPCHYVAFGDSVENADLLIEHRANVNAADNSGSRPLHVVTTAKTVPEPIRIAIARRFLNAKADVNAVNDKGEAPLHLALWEHLDGLASLYLDSHANPSLKDNAGRTPYSIARTVYKPDAPMLEALRAHGADSSAASPTNDLAIKFASDTSLSNRSRSIANIHVEKYICAVICGLEEL
jgi:ankyrin repeat protein/beta-lactamase regulating signal transducer with metallopeptidase domain